jgi:hypothetical protein
MKLYLFLISLIVFSISLHAAKWRIGPTRSYTYCSQIATLVQNGDTVEIDAAIYSNDLQVIWNKNNLFITGVGGRPRLEAGSIIANDMVNGKGIFVTSGTNIHVHNIEFANAVVQSHNGAGIRQEGANLLVTHCKFDGNEMGILSGNIPNCKTTVEYSEFLNGGSVKNPGYQHNIYINHIDSFVFRYNYSHDAIAEGHELKSRAAYNFILYNRIANETTTDSRCIDLPNGGTSVLVGNIIEQGQNSVNSNLLGYGLEGLTNAAPHKLYCTSNTFVNKKTTGNFIQVTGGTELLFVKNNIFAGAKTGGLFTGIPLLLDSSNNLIDNSVSSYGFENAALYNYHLKQSSICINKGLSLIEIIMGYALQPSKMYKDSCNGEQRYTYDGKIDIGAFEYAPLAVSLSSVLSISIFPNPVKDLVQIRTDELMATNMTFSLMTMYGQIILSQDLMKGFNNIDVSTLRRGIYIIRIGNVDENYIQKIILE